MDSSTGDTIAPPRYRVAARLTAVNLLLGGVALGLQGDVRLGPLVRVGALADWGGLLPPRNNEQGCNGDGSRAGCLTSLSVLMGYAALHPLAESAFDPHIELSVGAAFRGVKGGGTRNDAALGLGAGIDIRSRQVFGGPTVALLAFPTYPDETKTLALLVGFRAGAAF